MKNFRIANCRLALCQKQFTICSKCDRGQVYCSENCRVHGRRESLRRAGRLHQKSPEGARDHADRQAEYISRSKKKLTHHGSIFQFDSIRLPTSGLSEAILVSHHETDERNVNEIPETVSEEGSVDSSWDASPSEQMQFSVHQIIEQTSSLATEAYLLVCTICGQRGSGLVRYSGLRRFGRHRRTRFPLPRDRLDFSKPKDSLQH